MKNLIHMLLTTSFCFALFWNCESPSESDNANMAVLTGQVYNFENGDPVANAVVVILEYPTVSGFTNAAGTFTLELVVEETAEVQLRAFKESFISDTTAVIAVPGETVGNLTLMLEPTETTQLPSGEAASIILDKVSPSNVGVRESGAPEVAQIVYQVQDSAGIPVDLDHAVKVNFIIGSSPGGGEFISPLSAMTSANGKAETNLFTGTIAGVVQLIAEVYLGSDTVRSKPVAVAIHGGLPDLTHFSLAVEKLNFPGWHIYGLQDRITAYVGDKYGNPVKPETAVYFTTSGGIIEGSGFTDLLGQTSVALISAAPKPVHATLGPGFATVTGRTADEDENQIEAYAIVLFSGLPILEISPVSVNVPNGGGQSFSYTVRDLNLNPLSEGTNISVSVEEGDVKAVGNTNLTLPDTQSPGWTNFAFSLIDTAPDTNLVNGVSVKISTTGPNGKAEVSISGVAR